MTTETTTTPAQPAFTQVERRALRILHARYSLDRDLFSAHEREQLRFVRWLYENKRLES